jgi:hypothetical protein
VCERKRRWEVVAPASPAPSGGSDGTMARMKGRGVEGEEERIVRWWRDSLRSAASYVVLERAVAAAVASIIEIRVSGCIVLSENIACLRIFEALRYFLSKKPRVPFEMHVAD